MFQKTPLYAMKLLPWNEKAFITIRYDKISPELRTVTHMKRIQAEHIRKTPKNSPLFLWLLCSGLKTMRQIMKANQLPEMLPSII